jgi:hypothetical protein
MAVIVTWEWSSAAEAGLHSDERDTSEWAREGQYPLALLCSCGSEQQDADAGVTWQWLHVMVHRLA